VTASEIAELIGEMLELSDVAPDDNFFEVGGNSLLALRLIAQLEGRSGAQISLLDVVRAPTPGQLAALLAARDQHESEAAARAQ
jgi:enterobactin synthetase component F